MRPMYFIVALIITIVVIVLLMSMLSGTPSAFNSIFDNFIKGLGL